MELPLFFISDIHLMLERSDEEAKRQDILFRFLRYIKENGGTLVINGDLFDFYFEYKDVIPKVFVPFYYEILKIREAGIKVHYVLGNHDYWDFGYFQKRRRAPDCGRIWRAFPRRSTV